MDKSSLLFKLFRLAIVQVLIPYVLILLTPIRIIFDFFTITHPDFFSGIVKPQSHAEKVVRVQKQIENWIANGRRGRLCSGRPAWHSIHIRAFDKSSMNKIYLDMEDFVNIDAENEMLTVEPGMKMGTLTAKLIPLGWTIAVVPELETLTIGGLICGAGLESSSHKYGAFIDICKSLEVVLADGRCITCTRENEYSDIFYAIPMSYGTLGFITAVTIPLIPARRYVKLNYIPTSSLEETQELFHGETHEFIDAIVYGPGKIMIIAGTMEDSADPYKVQTFMGWHDRWFYKHAETFFSKPNSVEYVPLRDYYHRYQRGIFWTVAGLMPYGDQEWFRYLFGWVFPLNAQLGKLIRPSSGRIQDFLYESLVLQDFVVPLSKLQDVIELSHREVEIYPLWLCPCRSRMFNDNPRVDTTREVMYVDIGVYGYTEKSSYDMETVTRKFERFTLENNGYQGLYTDSFLTREEFNKMFDMKLYHEVREKLKCADAFPEAYDKISRAALEGNNQE